MTRSDETDRKAYQREYYEEHRKEIAVRRRDKYNSDPEYRMTAIRLASEHRRKKQAERKILVDAGVIPARKPREVVPEYVTINGRQVRAYRVAEAARRIGRSEDSLNKWTSKGMIPQTPFRSNGRVRLYTDSMIIVMKMAIQACGIVGSDMKARDRILAEWKSLGIPI